MSNFHRWKDPSWPGYVAIPGTPGAIALQPGGMNYDRVNVVSEGDGASGSAPADVAKIGGTNPTTYWVSFQEMATALNWNRGLRALAENTDYLDDILRRSIPRPVETAPVTPGSNVASVTLPVDVYLGPPGTTLSTAELQKLVKFLDVNGDELIDDASGSKICIVSVPGYPVSPADPYIVTTPVGCALNIQIPTGTTYSIVYGMRSSLTEIPDTGWMYPMRSDFSRTPAYVQNLFRQYRGTGGDWDAAPLISNYASARKGLSGAYYLNTGEGDPAYGPPLGYPGFNEYNTGGAGGWFYRTGPGIIGVSELSAYNQHTDYFGAIWKSLETDTVENPGTNAANAGQLVGLSIGYLYLGGRRTSMSSLDTKAPGVASFFAAARVSHDPAEADLRTRILAGQACVISMAGDDIVCTLTGTNSFFWNTYSLEKRTAIVAGVDCLELGYGRTYVIVEVTGQYVCKLRTLDGGNAATLGATTINAWVRPTTFFGDGATQYRYDNASSPDDRLQLKNFMQLAPPLDNDALAHLDAAAGSPSYNAYFGAYDNSSSAVALAWGGFSMNTTAGTGAYAWGGRLRGDGSLSAAYVFTAAVSQYYTYTTTSSNVTIDGTTAGDYSVNSTSTSNNFNVTMSSLRPAADYVVNIRRNTGIGYPLGQTVTFICTDTSGNAYQVSCEDGGGGLAPSSAPIVLALVTNTPVIDVFRVRLTDFGGGVRRAIITHHTVAG